MFENFLLCFVSVLLIVTQYNIWVVKTQLESLKETLKKLSIEKFKFMLYGTETRSLRDDPYFL